MFKRPLARFIVLLVIVGLLAFLLLTAFSGQSSGFNLVVTLSIVGASAIINYRRMVALENDRPQQ
ncbi:MAG: hypothetical protein J0M33_23850 [Anaerolineae bacterium]|nr:hypothetical protein [Anaerolineae bacterium]